MSDIYVYDLNKILSSGLEERMLFVNFRDHEDVILIKDSFIAGLITKLDAKDETIKRLTECVEFYAAIPASSGLKEAVINGGEYVSAGTMARQVLAALGGK